MVLLDFNPIENGILNTGMVPCEFNAGLKFQSKFNCENLLWINGGFSFTCYLYSHRGISSVSKSERFNCSTLSINCVFSTFNHTFNIRYSVQSFLLSTCGYCDGFLKLVTMKSLCKLEIPIMLSEESSWRNLQCRGRKTWALWCILYCTLDQLKSLVTLEMTSTWKWFS